MCACDEGVSYVCSRCAGTPQDYMWWWDERDPDDPALTDGVEDAVADWSAR